MFSKIITKVLILLAVCNVVYGYRKDPWWSVANVQTQGERRYKITLITPRVDSGIHEKLHVISHILHPAEDSLDYILKREGNFCIWLDAMERIKGVQPQIYDQFKRSNSSGTYFVPTDEAFKQLGDAKLQRLLGDKNYLTKTLQNHIVDNMLLSESFMPDLQYTVKTRGNPINIVRKNNRVLVNNATLVKGDILNKAGVAHEINSVLLPEHCSNGYRRIRDGSGRKVCL